MRVQLLTYDGPVGALEVPEFKKLPEVLVWGNRTFVLDVFASVQRPEATVPVYREGCTYVAAGDLLPEPPPPPPVDRTQRESTSGRIVNQGIPAPDPELDEHGMHRGYWVLTKEERAKGFVRPVRRTYRHIPCGSVTTMGVALAETYARDPGFYGATFCCHCQGHFPVGADGQFLWDGTDEKVGT